DRQRAEGVGDPLRHVLERSRHRHRNDRARRDGSRVAVRRAASGLALVDDRHAMAVALEVDRRRDTDDAGADDGDVAGRHSSCIFADETTRAQRWMSSRTILPKAAGPSPEISASRAAIIRLKSAFARIFVNSPSRRVTMRGEVPFGATTPTQTGAS